jgi:hypothetical protein
MPVLTIETIVAKYRNVVSEEGYIARHRRLGVPEAQLQKLRIFFRSELDEGLDLGIEEFEKHLKAENRIDQFSSYLELFESEERVRAMLSSLWCEPIDIFWPVFIEFWGRSDDTWYAKADVLKTLRLRTREKPATEFLDHKDRTFFDTLPSRCTVYRGSSRERVRGISWTTDREVAEGFAHGHRGIYVPDPTVAIAEIDKSAVFFASQDRKESEVVLDPRRLRRLILEPYRTNVRQAG